MEGQVGAMMMYFDDVHRFSMPCALSLITGTALYFHQPWDLPDVFRKHL